MSDIVEKTLASFPKLLSEGLLGVGGTQARTNKRDVPSGLKQLILTVHSVRSTSDEEQIVNKELSFLQQRLSQANQSNQQLRETYSRLLFCITLGYETEFAVIHVVKVAQQGTGLQKRLGYLLSCLLLHENHEMLVLLINTIQKDLKSTSLLDNCMALSAASQLLGAENIPMFLPLVLDKLKHRREFTRLKAAHCLYQFYLKAPGMVAHSQPSFQRALADKDPGVIQGIVQIYIAMAKENPADHQHLGDSFLAILNQIVEHSFPAIHEFHGVPLPWLQIQLLKVLGILGLESDELKQKMYPVLITVMKRSQMKQNIAFAVLYECILTMAKIGADQALLTEASSCVAKFLHSTNQTIKYLGVKALTALVDVSPEFAVQHQLSVVECLDGEDLAIQRKTLHLLYKMANQNNVKAICSKLFEHLCNTKDPHCKTDLAAKIVELAGNYSPSTQWYLETVNSVLQHTPDNTQLMGRLMDRVQQELSNRDAEFEEYLVSCYLPYLQTHTCPQSLLLVAAWVIGELNEGTKSVDTASVVSALCVPLSREEVGVSVKMQALSSLIKLVMKSQVDIRCMQEILASQKMEFSSPQLQQRYKEVLQLVALPEHQEKMLLHQYGKKTQPDFTLSFLDDYVCASLETNGTPYRPQVLHMVSSQTTDYGSAYQEIFSAATGADSLPSSQRSDTVSRDSSGNSSSQTRETGLQLSGVKRVWGREGMVGETGSYTTVCTDKQESPEEVRKQELAQALFEGISSDKQEFTKGSSHDKNVSSISSGSSSHSKDSIPESYLPSTDSSGWRAFSSKQNSAVTKDSMVDENTSGIDKTEENKDSQRLDTEPVASSSDSVVSSNSVVTSSNPAVMSSESVISSIMASSKDELSHSSQSERREVWLANEGSPKHVQYDSLASSDTVQSSIYDELTDQGLIAESNVLLADGGNSDMDTSEKPQSLYSEYDEES